MLLRRGSLQAFYGVFWATHYRPRIVVVLAIVQSVVFMVLFARFYRRAPGASPAYHAASAPAAARAQSHLPPAHRLLQGAQAEARVRRHAYGRKARTRSAAAGATAQVAVAAKAAQKTGDDLTGRPVLALNGEPELLRRRARTDAETNGYH